MRIGKNPLLRIVLTSFLLAFKYTQDMRFRMSLFAKVGGLSTQELINLEWEFCEIIGYRLAINEDTEKEYIWAILKYAWKERERLREIGR